MSTEKSVPNGAWNCKQTLYILQKRRYVIQEKSIYSSAAYSELVQERVLSQAYLKGRFSTFTLIASKFTPYRNSGHQKTYMQNSSSRMKY